MVHSMQKIHNFIIKVTGHNLQNNAQNIRLQPDLGYPATSYLDISISVFDGNFAVYTVYFSLKNKRG